MTRKTEFEELWSEINYTDRFDKNEFIFYYEGRTGLIPVAVPDMHKVEYGFNIFNNEGDEILVPEYRIWAGTYKNQLLFDRRDNYVGTKSMELPEFVYDLMNDKTQFEPLLKAIKHYGWSGEISRKLLINISARQKGDLTLYNYNTHVLVDPDHPLLVRCRGLVIDNNGIIVNYPFDRFFNIEEREHANIDWNSAKIWEKVDGTMISVFWHNGTWNVTTRGSFYPLGNGEYEDFESLFRQHFVNWDKLDPNLCYIFELVTRNNRNICVYEDEFVCLLGARNIQTLNEVDIRKISKETGLRIPKQYSANDIGAVRGLFNNLKNDEEGFVVVDRFNNRIKVKQESYLLLGRIKMGSPDELFQIAIGNESLDFEFSDVFVLHKIDMMKSHINNVIKKIKNTFITLPRAGDRKQFANAALQYPYSYALFLMYDDKFDVKKLRWEQIKNW